MRDKLVRRGPLILALILAVFCACILLVYVSPMEDLSLDLSLLPQGEEVPDPVEFDSKGWTVYTKESEHRGTEVCGVPGRGSDLLRHPGTG